MATTKLRVLKRMPEQPDQAEVLAEIKQRLDSIEALLLGSAPPPRRSTSKLSTTKLSRIEVDRVSLESGADRRSVLKEIGNPGSVRGRAGERIRAALRQL